ncbi:retrovirus-related pol polyprotein from transposon TNT 1-94 [Tanacetum coccineum]
MQVWKPTGKILTNVGYQWMPTRRTFTLGEQCPLTRLTKSKVVPAKQTENVSTSKTVITGKLSHTSQKPLTRYQRKNQPYQAVPGSIPTPLENQAFVYANQLEPNQNWGSNFPSSPSLSVFKCRKHSCYVRDTDGVELFKGSRGSNLYTISVEDMMKSSPICLLSKDTKNKSWLWHRRLNHLNFGTINDLARKDLVRGLPRLKFEKDHLCSTCQLGKSRKCTYSPKTENTNLEVLNTLHMDLCGPMRVQTINEKKYILVIVDDYSSIFYQKSVLRTPHQTDVVKRRNRTLVEAARTMLIFSKAPMFLWAEAVATACYTKN